MTDTYKRTCNVCCHDGFSALATRSDGMRVLRCECCQMGVIEYIPRDLSAFYTDDYYQGEGESGYRDYARMAEHGVGWAASLVKCLKPSGRLLDIGCADGFLLRRLGSAYEPYGVEVNEAMALVAAKAGVNVISRDLFAPGLLQNHRSSFDVITAIAVFEHLRDFKAGFTTALDLLRADGLLLFEVPLISETRDNAVWFTSSLEHVYYPTSTSICRLVTEELGLQLTGREIYVRDYASTYVGVISRDAAVAGATAELFDRLLCADHAPRTPIEREARLQLRLVHAATSCPDVVSDLDLLPQESFTPPLVGRLKQIWAADIRKLEETATLAGEGQTYIRDLIKARDWHAAQSEQLHRNHEELKKALDRAVADREKASARLDFSEKESLRRAAETERSQAQAVLASAMLARTKAELETARLEAQALADTLAAARAKNDLFSADVRTLEQRLDEVFRTNESQVEALAAAKARNDALNTEVDRLTAELLTLSRDRQLNLAQMVQAMIGAEARYQATSIRLRAVLDSNSWKATLPFQSFARKFPRAALIARNALKACWRQFGLATWASNMIRKEVEIAAPPKMGAALPPPDSRSFEGATGVVDATISPTADPEPSTPARAWPRDRPLVSIVIPCFNYGQFVCDAVESALAQTFTDLEVIVVEGGSSQLDSRLSVAKFNHARVRVLLQDKAARAGANRNFGISQARGKYVCCLDADDRIDPTYIEKAVFLLEYYEYDVVSTALKFFGNRSETCSVMEQPVLADMLEANHILTCAVFRRQIWEKAGGFHDFAEPEGYVYEDWAFWMRLAAMGARLWNISGESLFFYRSHSSASLSNSNPIPLDRQAALIRAFNADVLPAGAIERSSMRAAEKRRSMEPLSNLIRDHHDLAAGGTVLLALPFTIIGGAERLLSGVFSHLRAKGWRVIIVTTLPVAPEHGDTSDWFRGASSEIYHLPRFLAQARWIDFVRYLFAAKRVDLLLIVGNAFFYDLIPTFKELYPRLHIVDLLFNTAGHTSNNRKHARSIELTIVESKEVQNWLLDHGEGVKRIRLIESGVDLRTYRPRLKDRQILERLQIAKGTLIVGFSGRWSEEKDPLGFVEIARLTRAERVTFVMLGTGHMRPQIEGAIAAANFAQGRFHLVGPVTDVAPFVGSYDALCLPSRLDGRPLAVLEALAMGVPVLASHIGALPEVIDDGVNGRLFAPGDYEGFARSIDEIAASPQELAEMKVRARRFAERKLDARTMLESYEATLSSVLQQAVEPVARRANGSGMAPTIARTEPARPV